MREITAMQIDDGAIAPFGRYLPLTGPNESTRETVSGTGWVNIASAFPVLTTPPKIGRTRSGIAPFVCSAMERHRGTDEVIVCVKGDLVLAVAPPGRDAPAAGEVTALRLAEGDVVILDAGVWHDACRGVDMAADYLWMATSGVSPVEDRRWVALDGGDVTVRAGTGNGHRRIG